MKIAAKSVHAEHCTIKVLQYLKLFEIICHVFLFFITNFHGVFYVQCGKVCTLSECLPISCILLWLFSCVSS